VLYRIARAYIDVGEFESATPLLDECLDISRKKLELAFDFQSRSEQFELASDMRSRLAAYLMVTANAESSAERTYDHVLALKGAVFLRQWSIRQARDDSSLAELLSQLATVNRELAALLHFIPEADAGGAWYKKVGELEAGKDRLEHELAVLDGSRKKRQGYDLPRAKDVRLVLSDSTTLIDFFEYRPPADPSSPYWDAPDPELVAFVIRRDHPIARVALGSSREIGSMIDQWRKWFAFDSSRRAIAGTSDYDLAAARLFHELRRNSSSDVSTSMSELPLQLKVRIWQPLEKYLGDASTVLYCPDVALSFLPLAALPGEQPGTYLIEQYSLAAVPAAQWLSLVKEQDVLEIAQKTMTSALLVGDVDFQSQKDDGSTSAAFARLPGTKREIEAIAELYAILLAPHSATMLRGPQATKQAFMQQAPQHDIILLATHGFLDIDSLDNLPSVGELITQSTMMPFKTGAPVEDPITGDLIPGFPEPNPEYTEMLRKQRYRKLRQQFPEIGSGIALAGANEKPEFDEEHVTIHRDGILYAVEVADVDLRQVQLVTLSACQSGLGTQADGEGLLGLQRAFHVAGAESVVSSLWKVNDQATRLLMERFHANLWRKKMGKGDALREAQLWMLREGGKQKADGARGVADLDEAQPPSSDGRLPPYYWAAFVLSGDWR